MNLPSLNYREWAAVSAMVTAFMSEDIDPLTHLEAKLSARHLLEFLSAEERLRLLRGMIKAQREAVHDIARSMPKPKLQTDLLGGVE